MKKSTPTTLRTVSASWKLIWFLLHHLWQGKSLYRGYLHWMVKTLELKGEVLDLWSGSQTPSYLKHLSHTYSQIQFTDLIATTGHVLTLDLEKPFDLKKKYDAVLCFNVLEHIYEHRNLMAQAAKHLKKSGQFIGLVPYLHPYHKDPEDYYRYSHVTLERMCREAGFNTIDVTYIGMGPFLAGFAHILFVIPKLLRPVLFLGVVALDKFLDSYSQAFIHKYALSYFFVAQKN